MLRPQQSPALHLAGGQRGPAGKPRGADRPASRHLQLVTGDLFGLVPEAGMMVM